MTDFQEKRLAELEAKTDRTPEEEAVRVALLELDEREEAKVEADKALADAIAAQPTPPTPDPVAVAHQAVVDAQAAVDVAQKAVDDAEAAVAPVVA